jgi:hypothetical protein
MKVTPTEQLANLKKGLRKMEDPLRPMHNKSAAVGRNDRIMRGGYDYSPIVLRDHKLLLFTIPKVGCTVMRQLARRMMGMKDWSQADDQIPHNPEKNGLRYLEHYSLASATHMMTAPDWTRAVFVRDPHERMLSAYLDKAVQTNSHWSGKSHVERHCGYQPTSFATFVQTSCQDGHWEPQQSFIDEKWWPHISFVGHLETAAADMERLLRQVGAWEVYGRHGWGNVNGSIFVNNNMQERGTNANNKMEKYYDDATRAIVAEREGPITLHLARKGVLGRCSYYPSKHQP